MAWSANRSVRLGGSEFCVHLLLTGSPDHPIPPRYCPARSFADPPSEIEEGIPGQGNIGL